MTTKESIKTGLESRGVKGDNLLNSLDLAEDLADKNAEISPDGIVTLYHRTSEKKAREIVRMGRMVGKEADLFFGTHPTGQIEGYGDVAIRVRLPLEKLSLNDIFPHEAHVTMESGRIGTFMPIEAEIVEPNVWQMTKQEFLANPPEEVDIWLVENKPPHKGKIGSIPDFFGGPPTKGYRVANTVTPFDIAHKNIVKHALKEGKPVPREVLKDYPAMAGTEELIK